MLKKESFGASAFWMLIPTSLVVVLIWLPFGFSLSGLIEEWDVLGHFSQDGVFFWAGVHSSMLAHSLRPLTILPHALAYILDENSFFYWNLILMFSLIAKGFACALLVRRVTDSNSWGSIAGLLIVLYPADTMQLCFRSIHINCALALLLISSLFLMISWDKYGQKSSLAYALFSAIIFLTSILMYETGFILLGLPILTLIIRDGFMEVLDGIKKRISLLSVWLLGAVSYLSYVMYTAPKIHSYQQDVAAVPFSTLIQSMPQILQIVLFRLPLGGWCDATGIVLQEYKNYTYLLLVTGFLISVVAIICMKQRSLREAELPVGGLKGMTSLTALRMIGLGAACGILGCVPYLINPIFFLLSAQRVYLYAAYGASLFWCGVLMLVRNRTRTVAGVIAGLMILLGMGAQLYQIHHYIGISERQRMLLKSVAEHFSGDVGQKTLLICDRSNQIGQVWFFMPERANLMFSYLYGTRVDSAKLCHYPSMEWYCSNGQNRAGLIIETPTEWRFIHPEDFKGPGYVPKPALKDQVLPKSKVIAITTDIDPSLSSELDLEKKQKELFEGKSILAKRYRGFLVREPWPLRFNMFNDDSIAAKYRLNLGTWWGYDNPLFGSGWCCAEWRWGGGFHKNLAWCWKTQKMSSIDFMIRPTFERYVIQGTCIAFANDGIRQGLKIMVNNLPIAYQWMPGGRFSGEVDPKILKKGKNTISFYSDIDREFFGLSFALEFLEIKPLSIARHKGPASIVREL